MIPRLLHRTLPAEPRADVPPIWATVVANTQGWERRTYQSPRDPADWPMTGHLFGRCHDRAMESNLVRLEALWVHGGVYVDSDVSLVRPLEPLLAHGFFVGWEDGEWLGTAVLGAVAGHPATAAALDAMCAHVAAAGPRSTAPRVLTPILKGRVDVVRLPRETFYPVPYKGQGSTDGDGVFAVHHWHNSWM
jgi:hypothetical protein